MKLIVAIVQDEDAGRLVSALMDKGFGVTKLATTGGFLRAGNTTLISGVEDDKLQDALNVIEKICKSREQITASTTPMGGAGGVYVKKFLDFVCDATRGRHFNIWTPPWMSSSTTRKRPISSTAAVYLYPAPYRF